MPTVVGNSIILASPFQYYAFDRTTGAPNHFYATGGSGGGGTTVAYDAARSQFYVNEVYTDATPTLSAYHYIDNDHISLLWQRTGAGVSEGQSVAIGPDGKVYSAGNIVIWELDPTTGSTLRTIPGHFANGMTPLLSNGVIWTFSDQDNGGTEQTFAYDLNSLQILKVFQATRGSLNTAYDGAGAVCNNHFLLDYGTIFGRPGFDVYSAPGPVHLSGAVSRMTHGSAGTFDVSLPVTGAPGIECRSGGANGNYQIVFTFDETLVGVTGGANVASGTGSISSSQIDPNDGHNYIVNLTAVANAQFLTVALTNVSDSVGGFTSHASATVGVLLGDTNGDGVVNVGDTVQVRSEAGNDITSLNFRRDVNADGLFNVGDTIITRTPIWHGLADRNGVATYQAASQNRKAGIPKHRYWSITPRIQT